MELANKVTQLWAVFASENSATAAERLRSWFVHSRVRINTPLAGAIETEEQLPNFIDCQKKTLLELGAEIRVLSHWATSTHIAGEWVIDATSKGFDLPVSFVGELHPSGLLNQLRIYYSTWPFGGSHLVRSPLVQPAPGLHEPHILEVYFKALADGDKQTILSTFTADAYLREPSGERFKHLGHDGRKHFFDMAFVDGGVRVNHATVIWSGNLCAVEYVCDQWGTSTLPPQAGMAVYELSDDQKLIKAARIYDDVSPPSPPAQH